MKTGEWRNDSRNINYIVDKRYKEGNVKKLKEHRDDSNLETIRNLNVVESFIKSFGTMDETCNETFG